LECGDSSPLFLFHPKKAAVSRRAPNPVFVGKNQSGDESPHSK
jgi:hypothetical protein